MNEKKQHPTKRRVAGGSVAQEKECARWSPTRFDARKFLAECWSLSTVVASQSWGAHEAEFPGHDPGEPTKMFFGILLFGQRMLLLSNGDGSKIEESEDGPATVRACANLPASWDSLKGALELEKFDGWSFRMRLPGLPEVDSSEKLEKLISDCYTPLPGSDLTPNSVVAIAAQVSGREMYQYVRATGGAVRLGAVAAYRAGITSGVFIYDEGFVEVLNALKTPVEKVESVVKTNVSPEVIEIMILRKKQERQRGYLQHLESELEKAEQVAKSLRLQINRLKE
jgi:hypothetical protein